MATDITFVTQKKKLCAVFVSLPLQLYFEYLADNYAIKRGLKFNTTTFTKIFRTGEDRKERPFLFFLRKSRIS